MLKIFDLNKLQLLTLVYNSRSKNIPEEKIAFFERFKFTLRSSVYSMRSSGSLEVPAYRTNIRKFSISIAGPLTWNSLPNYILNAQSIYSLKKLYTKYVMNSYLGFNSA